jgi:Uma2 family endonuclease
MTAVPKRETMSAEAFLEWAEAQDEGQYRLIGGKILAIAQANLPCPAFVDGAGVNIEGMAVFIPEALVDSGARIPRGSLIAPNPVIVLEVISPTSTRRDLAVKFSVCFRHPGVQHYLVVVMESRTVIQHSRSEGDTLKTRTAGMSDSSTFDPPGIAVAASGLFKGLDSAFIGEQGPATPAQIAPGAALRNFTNGAAGGNTALPDYAHRNIGEAERGA